MASLPFLAEFTTAFLSHPESASGDGAEEMHYANV